jgi:predicted nucleic acid-binding protein
LEKLFIDTGAWIALNNRKDKYHEKAVVANKEFLDAKYFYVTTDYVMDETYTLVRYDVGHKRAIEFGKEIKALQEKEKIKVIHISESILDSAWKIFEKYSDKDFSFTDCTSFVIMEQVGITETFSFDKHFEQYGFIRLPFLD